MRIFDQARTEVKAAQGRIARAWSALIGARVTVAVSCMFALAFGMALLIAPSRLPPIGGLSLAQVGLPSLEFGKEKEIAGEIIDAAGRQGAPDAVRDFFTQNPQFVPIANWTGFAIALATLIVAIILQIRLRRRGVEPL